MNAREWLLENGYVEVADLIDEIQAEWKAQGKKTRRNWWDVLAGRKDGSPSIIAGREFPVLRAAQSRQKRPVTENSVARANEVAVPSKEEQARWRGHVRQKYN